MSYFIGFQSLFSYTLTSNEEVSFRKLLEFYSPSLDVNNSIAELKLWKIKLERIHNIPNFIHYNCVMPIFIQMCILL